MENRLAVSQIVKKITPSGFMEREQGQPLLVMVIEYEEKN